MANHGIPIRAGGRFSGVASRRGGILDIYPVNSNMPARIELWGNEIDSIRLFDPATQRSTDVVESVDVTPAQEILPALTDHDSLEGLMTRMDFSNCTDTARGRIEHELSLLQDGHELEEANFYSGLFSHGSLLDYFPKDGLLVMLRPSEIAETAWATEERIHELRKVKEQRGELPANFPVAYLAWNEVEEQATAIKRRMDIVSWGADDLVQQDIHVLPFASSPTFMGKLDSFVEEANELAQERHRVVAVTSHSKRLGEILGEYGAEATIQASLDEPPAPGSITVLQSGGAGLGDGFVLSVAGQKLPSSETARYSGLASSAGLPGVNAPRREALLAELTPGGYVVHVEHGIGRFSGTGHMPDDRGRHRVFNRPLRQGRQAVRSHGTSDRITPYIAPMDHPPSLTRLGTQEWRRTKERVARSAKEMAAELLSLYAARELVEGYALLLGYAVAG